MFWRSLVGADRPPKEAMPVANACLAGIFGFWCPLLGAEGIRPEKIADGRVPLPARSG